MAETLTPAQRSERMRRVRNKDMKPELRVRRLVHAMGYRFRLHRKDLPGKPDMVFPGRMAVILVHGCFWHRFGTGSSTASATTIRGGGAVGAPAWCRCGISYILAGDGL